MKVPMFILFAHPRSGSTTLANLLNLHPDLSVLMEPFQEEFSEWFPGQPNYFQRITDARSLDAQLAEIFTTYNGFKTICWPLPFELYAHMLSHGKHRTIFLRRRNKLKASVSCAISHRLGAWRKQDLPENADSLYKALGPIPLDEILDWAEAVQTHMDEYEAILDTKPTQTVMKVAYEDLYGTEVQQRKMLHTIFDFLGVSRIWTGEMEDLLDRRKNQMNTTAMYRFIPNHREIDEAGSRRGYNSLFAE